MTEHGTYCSSAFVSSADIVGKSFTGDPVDVFVSVVGQYTHGVYHRSERYGSPNPPKFARLTFLGDGFEPDTADDPWEEGKHLHIKSQDARALAAALIRAADVLDRLDMDRRPKRRYPG